MSKRKAIDLSVQMNISEIEELVTFIIETNKKLQEIGEDPIAINIQGPSGIGKTSVVKQIGIKNGVTNFVKKNLAQIDDLGEIVGFPLKEYEVKKDVVNPTTKEVKSNIKWVPEAVLHIAEKKGYEATSRVRQGYAKPEWLVGKEKERCILFLDDFNRCQPRFLQAIMEIVDNQSYFSWKLPPGSTVVLSSNPDNGSYNVSSEDDAQTSRYFRVAAKFDAKVWARYAEKINLDERGINFLLLHPELVTDTCNARIITKFFNSIRFIDDFSKPESLLMIQTLGEASVGSAFVTTFVQFIHDKLDKMISPKDIFDYQDFSVAKAQITKLIGKGDSIRLDLASVLTHRIINYVLTCIEKPGTFTQAMSLRVGELISAEDFLPGDLSYILARETVSGNRNRFLNILGNPQVVSKLTS